MFAFSVIIYIYAFKQFNVICTYILIFLTFAKYYLCVYICLYNLNLIFLENSL